MDFSWFWRFWYFSVLKRIWYWREIRFCRHRPLRCLKCYRRAWWTMYDFSYCRQHRPGLDWDPEEDGEMDVIRLFTEGKNMNTGQTHTDSSLLDKLRTVTETGGLPILMADVKYSIGGTQSPEDMETAWRMQEAQRKALWDAAAERPLRERADV